MRMRAVVVEPLPRITTEREKQSFLREIRSCLVVDRPRLVLDCSAIGQLDQPVVELLLTCLEEAMKRNGDVKLAAVPGPARASLKQVGVSDLFEVYNTVVEAVNSFRRFAPGSVPQTRDKYSERESESAA